VRSLNNWDDENRLKSGGLNGIELDFWDLAILGELQRRGAHVKTPEIGSRDGRKCFWGNLRVYAVLRRELELGS
jgi:hypothetical protein